MSSQIEPNTAISFWLSVISYLYVSAKCEVCSVHDFMLLPLKCETVYATDFGLPTSH